MIPMRSTAPFQDRMDYLVETAVQSAGIAMKGVKQEFTKAGAWQGSAVKVELASFLEREGQAFIKESLKSFDLARRPLLADRRGLQTILLGAVESYLDQASQFGLDKGNAFPHAAERNALFLRDVEVVGARLRGLVDQHGRGLVEKPESFAQRHPMLDKLIWIVVGALVTLATQALTGAG